MAFALILLVISVLALIYFLVEPFFSGDERGKVPEDKIIPPYRDGGM